jgi:hypothetical protein
VAKQEVKAHEKAMHGMKKGGMAYAKGGVTRADGCVTKGHTKGKMIAMKKVAGIEATKVVNKHEKSMHKMAKGGVTRADGCVSKGHTKGKMVKMCMGGKA